MKELTEKEINDRAIELREELTGAVRYFRNNSIGKATLVHLLNDATTKSFCGFFDTFAEVVIIDESDYLIEEASVCKKCLKAFRSIPPSSIK